MTEFLRNRDIFHDDGFPIVIARREPQPPFPLHRHQFSELVIVTGGTGIHAIRKEEYPITTGDVFVINDDSPHEYRDMDALALVNILFQPEQLFMSQWDTRALPGYHVLFKLEPTYRKRHKFESRLRLTVDDLAKVKNLVDCLDQELQIRNPGFRLTATSIFMQLVAYLSRSYGQSREQSSRDLLRIGSAISFIEYNFNEKIDLDNLAKTAHMSRRNFSRVFREAMGHSAINYLVRLRISRAMDIMRQKPDASITEIACETGFEDSNYFTRQFKYITGFTPSSFRNMNTMKPSL